jgi:hypothetical protein
MSIIGMSRAGTCYPGNKKALPINQKSFQYVEEEMEALI